MKLIKWAALVIPILFAGLIALAYLNTWLNPKAVSKHEHEAREAQAAAQAIFDAKIKAAAQAEADAAPAKAKAEAEAKIAAKAKDEAEAKIAAKAEADAAAAKAEAATAKAEADALAEIERRPVLSATKLAQAYDTNRFAADDKYKGKYVIITGEITDIEQTPIVGNPIVILDDDIHCLFENDDRPAITKLVKGQKVAITGKISGEIFASIVISDCKLVSLQQQIEQPRMVKD